MWSSKAKKVLGTFLTSFLFLSEGHALDDYCCDCSNGFWADAEYIYWKIKDSPEPVPLVATAPVIHNGSPLIGQPGTKVVLGDDRIQTGWRSGGKFSVGYRISDEYCFGVEANYFFLPTRSRKHSVSASGEPGSTYLAVPYFNTVTHSESSSPVATPGTFRGLANLKLSNDMQGAEINGWALLYNGCSYKVNTLIGFRYWNFNESLKFFVDSPAIAIPDEVFLVRDRFRTINNFYGGQIGLTLDGKLSCFTFCVKGKLALGAMCEEAKIHGRFTTNAFDGFGAPENFPGGYFALLSNSGHHKDTRFAVIPDVNVNIGYQVTDCISIKLGYSFLYVNKMLWAGKQLNRNINPTQSSLYEFTATPTLEGQPKPKSSNRTDSLWAQGLNVGVEWTF